MGNDGLSIGLLGPLEVRVRDGDRARDLELPGGKPRILLACLALSAGRTVPVDVLVERLWGADQPPRARGSLQNNVLRLRRLLGPGAIHTTADGYRLLVEPEQVDALRMLRLLDAANRAEPMSARMLLAEACALWRGDPLTGVGSESLERDHRPVLTERYLSALERRIDLDLVLGTGTGGLAGLVAELRELTSRFPLRESLWERLLNVLSRAGRQAEALEAFEELRTLLADTLGADPSTRLRMLHRRILAETGERPGEAGPSAGHDTLPTLLAVPPPAQLPFDVADFLGREEELRQVSDRLARRRETLPVVVVSGQPGVGKTTFAVHVAHQVADAFPDGQLYAHLADAEGRPKPAREILAAFLRTLGAVPAAIPEAVEERSALFRSLLRGRRMLVVLDNASTEAQVRPLLPGGSDAAVLITSRSPLAGLAGASLITLEVLDSVHALGLLSAVAGPERFDDEDSGHAIVRLCGRLPLAIRIAGSRLAARPHWRARDLVERLKDERSRLDELTQGDLEVRASFAVAYEELDPPLRRAFRRLGLLDAPTFPAWPAAALLDCPLEEAERLVEHLADARLLEVAGRDAAGQVRYRFHDLLRLFARERADAEDSPDERHASVIRALQGWLAAAQSAASALPKTFPTRPPQARIWEPAVDATRRARRDADAWFGSERAALVAAIEQACTLTTDARPQGADVRSAGSDPAAGKADSAETGAGPAGRTGSIGTGTGPTDGDAGAAGAELPAALAASISSYLDARGFFDEWRRVYEAALTAARRTQHRSAQVALLCDLGEVHSVQDRLGDARACFVEAESLARAGGDVAREAMAASSLGYLARLQSDYAEALAKYRAALSLARQAGDLLTQAHATQGLGNVAFDKGRMEEARQHFVEALELSRASEFVVCAVRALRGLALVERHHGRLDQATAHLREALAELDRHDNALGRAHVRLDLADLYRLDGRDDEARRLYDECLPVFARHGERFGVAQVRQGLGLLDAARGDYRLARKQLEEAADILADLDMPLWHGRCLADLGQVIAASGDHVRAAEVAARARALGARATTS